MIILKVTKKQGFILSLKSVFLEGPQRVGRGGGGQIGLFRVKTRGLHYFCHLNVNSLLSKIDELIGITNYIRPVILSVTESKIDISVTNAEVNINGYSIIRNDRNSNGRGAACYTGNNLCFNINNIFSNSIEHVFFEILIPKVKPIAIGIFYSTQIIF